MSLTYIATSSSAGSGLLALLLVVLILSLYFLPTIIALMRHRQSPGVIVVLNVLLGWLLIPWIICLAMAFGPTCEQYVGNRYP
jgi:RsiW-degrading membrane proteinase PrsW (M82 family)